MAKKFILVTSIRAGLPRIKRLRPLGVIGTSYTASVPEGHTHQNLPQLDMIRIADDGYMYFERTAEVANADTGETEILPVTEKVKAGFADLALDLTEDSPSRIKMDNFIGGVESLLVPVEKEGTSIVDRTFEWALQNPTKVFAIRAKYGLYSDSFLSAKGLGSGSAGSGGGSSWGLMRTWDPAEEGNASTEYALGANLGWELKRMIEGLPSTSVNPYALTLQKNGSTVATYDGGSAVTANIAIDWGDVGSKPSWIGSTKPTYGWGEITGKPSLVTVGSDGVSEIGRYIDFHYGTSYPNSSVDFTVRLDGGTASDRKFTFPASGGELVVASSLANYVTALGTNGNYLTWTRGGATSNITVPYATNADTLDGFHSQTASAGQVAIWQDLGSFGVNNNGNTDDTANYKNFLRRITGSSPYGSELAGTRFLGTLVPNSQRFIVGRAYSKDAYLDGFPQYSYFLGFGLDGRIFTFGSIQGEYYQHSIAFTTDTVAKANQLATARTLWGQSFDGSGNVSGNMTGVGAISPAADTNYNLGSSSNQFRWGYFNGIYAKAGSWLGLGANNTDHIRINTDGKVGVGTTSPAYDLDVAGTVRATGDIWFDTWGRITNSNGGWLQMTNATNHISALNGAQMTQLTLHATTVQALNGQFDAYDSSSGNRTQIVRGGIELSHSTPYVDFHYGRSTADFTARIIADEENSLHILGGSNFKLKIGNGYIQWDSTYGMFRLSHGIYSDGQITAKGPASSSGSSSSGKETGGVLIGNDGDVSGIIAQSEESGYAVGDAGIDALWAEISALWARIAQLEDMINLK